ncbi:hypothetical protein Ppa06_64900 [Planomonospora parontospora subsp. parontospora]|uniref:Transcriptional regulator n=2 Tax=Planomonospora parontospora TaxID=58119 RepID=A0AA37BNA3_9ACTN|nr:hypothetical protein [Planomonospora parontospora]GGK97195.1 hypothetical protein GCM10010126_65820 [Planomonospora parontospora]GII12692.1 hypothetical protein Ppa06_64900 [Planomonospora parontospora subsp. parontospora]
MERQPNRSLQRLIAEAGFTYKGLARNLNELGRARGLSGLKYDHSSVLRWLGGQRPREPVPALLAEIFSLRLGRTVTPEDMDMSATTASLDVGQEFPHTWDEGVASVTALWRADVERRRFLVDSTFAIGAGSVGAVRWLTLPTESRPVAGGSRRVGTTDIAAIREVTRSFGELDNRFGGGRIRSAVVKYLDTAVAPLLNDGSYAEATGRELASAAAELTRLAGWMAYDLEHHGVAQRYLIQALRLARGAGDHGLGGEILAGMSHQAAYIGQPAHALDLARAARLSAQRAGVFSLLAEAHALEAHAQALLGDRTACRAALHQAELAFDRRRPGDEPEWIAYFDEAYLSAKVAHCFRDLRDGTQAVRHARRSLEMDGRFVRGRMFNLSLLAAGLLECGELEEACTAAGEALELAGGLQSARTRSYVTDLRRRLEPHAAEPAVVELNERIRELTPA